MAQPSTKLLAIFMAVAASGSAPPSKVRRPMRLEQRLALAPSRRRARRRTTPAVPEETSSGRPIIGAATSIWPLLGVRRLDLADDRDAVGAGADVDAALGQRCRAARRSGTRRLPAPRRRPAWCRRRRRSARRRRSRPTILAPASTSGFAFSGGAVVDADLVLGVEQAADHGLAHAARPDETDFHGVPPCQLHAALPRERASAGGSKVRASPCARSPGPALRATSARCSSRGRYCNCPRTHSSSRET